MPTLRFRLLNVFAESTFGGNPLCVIEDAQGLSDEDMQLIARQFNLSETTFLFPSDCAAARIRIFTPTYEMPFAGHPTLGSAHVVRELFGAGDSFGLEMKAGVIPVRARGDHWMLLANAPSHWPMAATPVELAAMLRLPDDAIVGPALWLNCGTEQSMIPLRSIEHVHAVRPNGTLLAQYSVNTSGQPKCYVFARTTEGFEARYFWMAGDSVCEDPATGSACANLGGWWQVTQGETPLHARVLQATAINRPSVLSLDVAEGRIEVGGRVVPLGSGELSW